MAADSAKIKLLYHPDKRRVGCVLLQAVVGGCTHTAHFWTDSPWITAPEEGMRMFSGTREEWEEIARMDNEAARAERSA